MVVQSAIDNLKEKPHDEKKAVASGIAIAVVIILLIGWGFLFLRKIQRGGTPTLEGAAVPRDQFDANFLQNTQRELNQAYDTSSDQLRDIRDNSAQNQVAGPSQNTESVSAEGNVQGFGEEP